MTKTFTVTLLAQAIVDGKVNLDDDFRKFLQDTFPNLAYESKPITFAHLVTHQSGLPFMFPEIEGLFEEQDPTKLTLKINQISSGFTKTQFFDALAKVQLDTFPGSNFGYSNAGANLLGYCLENIYQKDYETMLNQFIFKELNMKNSGINLSDKASKKIVKGFTIEGIPMPLITYKNMNADGGIKANLPDILKYMAFHLDKNNPVVKVAHSELWEGKFGAWDAGYFWQIFKYENGQRKIFQNGGAPGTSSWMTLIPETQTGIFIVTNTSGPDVHQQISEFADKIIKELNSKQY